MRDEDKTKSLWNGAGHHPHRADFCPLFWWSVVSDRRLTAERGCYSRALTTTSPKARDHEPIERYICVIMRMNTLQPVTLLS